MALEEGCHPSKVGQVGHAPEWHREGEFWAERARERQFRVQLVKAAGRITPAAVGDAIFESRVHFSYILKPFFFRGLRRMNDIL
jgi:hypothetical protein